MIDLSDAFLRRVFQMVMEHFLALIDEFQPMAQPLDKEFFTTLLVDSARQIDRASHQLLFMAKTYFDVSSEFLVNKVDRLNSFLLLPTDAERDAQFQILASQRTAISNRVTELATQRQEEYTDYVEESTKQEILGLFGGVTIGKRR